MHNFKGVLYALNDAKICEYIYKIVCSYTDYINDNKLAQDHPCVIKLIRHMYMNSPSPRDVPYNLTTPGITLTNITPGLYPDARNGSGMEIFLLKNKVRNFTVSFSNEKN